MAKLVLFKTTEDGEDEPNKHWHLSTTQSGSSRSACGGQVYGFGESGIQYDTKYESIKSINCPLCIEIIKFYKNLK